MNQELKNGIEALRPEEAESLGALAEDALSEADARASVGDDHFEPAEALVKRVSEKG